MKRYILAVIFSVCMISCDAAAQTDTTKTTQTEEAKTGRAKSSPAVWIALGTVFLCVFVGLNARKMKKHRE